MRATGVPRSSRISGGVLGNPHTLSRAPVVVVPRLAPDLGRRPGLEWRRKPSSGLALVPDSLVLDSRGGSCRSVRGQASASRYCRAMATRISLSVSVISSPDTLTVTLCSVPVNRYGDR
jgi:hypothetical protein